MILADDGYAGSSKDVLMAEVILNGFFRECPCQWERMALPLQSL